jgi:hypothetical protein
VECPLPDDGHIQVVDHCDLQTFGTLVVVAVVKGLDIEENAA